MNPARSCFSVQRGDGGARTCCHGNEADLDPSVLAFCYLPCCFICKYGRGQGISIFLSRLNELLSRFVYPRFQFSAQPEICCFARFFSDILYFHSCGIVGIMTVI